MFMPVMVVFIMCIMVMLVIVFVMLVAVLIMVVVMLVVVIRCRWVAHGISLSGCCSFIIIQPYIEHSTESQGDREGRPYNTMASPIDS